MRKQILFTALFSVFIVLAACGTGTNDEVDEDPPVETEEQPAVETEDEDDTTRDEDDGTATEPDNNAIDDDNADDQDGEKITETGTYNGQADPHTIEIETDDGPLAFQLTMEARDDVEALTVGGKVKYTYTEDGDQRTIEKIEPAE